MENLDQAFSYLNKNISFIYNLTNKQQKNTKLFDTVLEFGEYYDFLDKTNFDANLKSFILNHSDLLHKCDYSIFCFLDTENKKVFFEILKKRKNA